MKQFIIFIYLLFLLINRQYASPIYLSSSEDNQNEPSLSWYNTIRSLENRRYQRPIDRFYKRFVNDIILPERQRRFGNTKYGRSIPDE
jgi:hypothetical protein